MLLRLLTVVALSITVGGLATAADQPQGLVGDANRTADWQDGRILRTGRHQALIIDASDIATTAILAGAGATRVADYGAFTLWRVPGAQADAVLSRPGAAISRSSTTIWLRGGAAIDTRLPQAGAAAGVPEALRQSRTAGPQFWLVQFAGPIQDAWLDELRARGLEIVIYMPDDAYVVWGDGAALAQLDAFAAEDPAIQWTGAYHPAYRLAPELRALTQNALENPAGLVDVTVQFYNTPAVDRSVAALRAFGGRVYKEPSVVLDFTDITLQLPAGQLQAVAGWPDVFNVEPWRAPVMLDEAQGQIVAGNVTTVGANVVPSGPGYLAWLTALGFPTDPAQYPVVDVVDDGIDQGDASDVLHPDFHELGAAANPDRVAYIQNCTTDATGNGVEGHGNLNAGIVAAYNNLTGSPHVDANGYRLDLGISPFGRVAGTKVFDSAGYDISACGASDASVVAKSYTAGATFTSNSWGADTAGAYDASAQAYDRLTRDASSSTPGNQQMLHIFAAGNAGASGSQTVDSPGTAKNVLTVGATENVRGQGVSDGCGVTSANNADDVATFSSRGPAADGRARPDIMAPGTHVQGPASQDPGYNGAGVCGGNPNPPNIYYPAGQTLYTWSSGTSHSTPALAGAASLLYNYYGRVLVPGATPSPAMLKALLINSSRYLTGLSANDTLPSNNQGWGDVNLGVLFDGTPRILVDQTTLLGATGQAYTLTGALSDPTRPFRATLAWTDAPGSTSGNAYVNNLDLEVTIGGTTYKGNVFSGAFSAASGTADARNNVENVFLPAGITGPFTVRVIAANLPGDGVSGNGDATDQDFALAVYNGAPTVQPVLARAAIQWSDATGNANGHADPGETLGLAIGLTNIGNAGATGVDGAVTSGDAIMVNDMSAYADIAAGVIVTDTTPYTVTVPLAQACGSALTFTQTFTYNVTLSGAHTFTMLIGENTVGQAMTYTYSGLSVAIPDNNPTGASVSIPISAPGTVVDVNARVSIVHTWDRDLVLSLISPAGTTVTLANQRGSSGHNYTNTIFDDQAANSISSGSAPFTGSYRPETPLSAVNNQPLSGTWILKAVDKATLDTGSITAFSLSIQMQMYTCEAVPAVAPIASIVPSGGDLTLSWPHAEPDASYQVWRDPAVPYFAPTDPAASIVSCTISSGGVRTCVDTASGPTAFYVIRAFNTAGAWADSNRIGRFSFAVEPGVP